MFRTDLVGHSGHALVSVPAMKLSAVLVPAALVSMFAAVAACGGGDKPAESPSGSSSSAPSASAAPSAAPATSGSAAPAGGAWSASWSKQEKVAFMSQNVSPRMGKVFQAHDGSRYASFGCKTCHGEGKAPKDHLPKLTMKDGKITSFADKPAVSKFMAENVVPEMAAAMGQKPYDPQTHQGFGCGGCHAIEMK